MLPGALFPAGYRHFSTLPIGSNLFLNYTNHSEKLSDKRKFAIVKTWNIRVFSFIFSRILPFGHEGPKWQDCFDTFW